MPDAEADAIVVPVDHAHERADVATLHRVYARLLELLRVNAGHREALHARGFTDDEVATLGYRSFPEGQDANLRLCDALEAEFSLAVLLTVPGFDAPEKHIHGGTEPVLDLDGKPVLDADGKPAMRSTTLRLTQVKLSGAPGLLLPQRDEHGRIEALVLRVDMPGKTGARYLSVTSYTYAGAPGKVGLHHPLQTGKADVQSVRIIEGIFKADLTQRRTGMQTIGIPTGGQFLRGAKEALKSATSITFAPDADTPRTASILGALVTAADYAASQGAELTIETWDESRGKGLDDVIAGGWGYSVEFLRGVDLWRQLIRLAAPAGVPHAQAVARVALHDVECRTALDPQYVFRDSITTAFAFLEADTPEVQRVLTAVRAHLDTKTRTALDRAIGKKRKGRAEAETKRAKERVREERDEQGVHTFVRGDDVELRDVLHDALTPVGGSSHDPDLIVHDDGELHKFDHLTGLWCAKPHAELITMVATYAGSPLGDEGSLYLSHAKCRGSVQLLADKASNPAFFSRAPHGVAFANTFLRVQMVKGAHPTIAPEPLARDHRARARFECDYQKGAIPTRYLELLRTAFRGNPEVEELIQVIRQFHGLSILGLAPKFQRALIFLGDGQDGKSTIANVIRETMPKGTTIGIPPQSMGKEYSRAAFAGKLLNVVFETPEGEIMASTDVKAIIVGDAVEARNPYQAPFMVESRAGNLFVCNVLAKIKDTTFAFRRRWIIFEFKNKVGAEEMDRFFVERLLEEETASIVSWAIDGAIELLGMDDYNIPECSEQAVSAWMDESDAIAQFACTSLAILKGANLADLSRWTKGSPTLYDAYKYWSKDDGHGTPLTSRRFLRRLNKWLKEEGRLPPNAPASDHRADGEYYPVRLRDHGDHPDHPARLNGSGSENVSMPVPDEVRRVRMQLTHVNVHAGIDGRTLLTLRGLDDPQLVARHEVDPRDSRWLLQGRDFDVGIAEDPNGDGYVVVRDDFTN